MLARTRLASTLARRAGELIRDAAEARLAMRADGAPATVDFKSEVDPVTEVDLRSQALIVEAIHREFPGDEIVAEEDGHDCEASGPCWYIDPLDGTVNFVHGLPHYGVSIAYYEGTAAVSAAVCDPSRGELFTAERGGGAFLGKQRIRVSAAPALGDALFVTGFPYDRRARVDEYLPYFREMLISARDVRRFGSASLDLCYVACGRFDGFWEWGLRPWDTAAGRLIVEEAGGRVTEFDGSAYDPWQVRILASNGLLHDEAAQVLARAAAH